MELFHKILKTAVAGGASDVHLKVGTPVVFRTNRELLAIECPNREVCGTVRSKAVASAKATRGAAMKTLGSLLVVLSCGLRPAFGATNDTHGTPPVTMIAPSLPAAVTTTIPENVLFQYAVKEMDTNSLNANSIGKLSTPGQQAAPTNSVPPVILTTLAPVDESAITRVNRRREYFSDQDKYGGILYKAYRAENPLQLINPFAPRGYGQSEAAELPRDRLTDVPSGFSVFSIRFK
jgi:hypothetical protein